MTFKIIVAAGFAALYALPAIAWEYGINEDVFNGNTKYASAWSNTQDSLLTVTEKNVAFIVTTEYFCSDRDDEVNMRYIIDGEEQDTAYVKVGSNSSSIIPSYNIADFIQKLIDGNELIVRISDRCGDIVDYKFDISGNPTKEWQ